MDTLLANGQWLQWRESHSGETAILAQGARAWCTSSFWKNHTPRLEHWKQALFDLYEQTLSEEDVADMAQQSSSPVCFPLIPLFEHDQVSEFMPLVEDMMTAARLAEQLTRASMLSLRSEDVPKLCWDLMAASNKEGWDFDTWRWLIFPSEMGDKAWPSERGVRTLYSAGSQRAAEAALFLRQVAEERSQAAEPDPGASAALAILNKLSQPSAGVEAPLAADVALPHSRESGRSIGAEYKTLYEELFTDPLDMPRWKAVEEATLSRAMDAAARPPLSEMAGHLAQSDISSHGDHTAWHNLASLLQQCPRLMQADAADPQSPLPILEFAAAVRSTVPIGRVAVDLLRLASSAERQNPEWWRALKAGLKPLTRRGGLQLANDRIRHAVAVVAFQARWISQTERRAMETIFNLEKMHDRQ